jgi:hypothetical protein
MHEERNAVFTMAERRVFVVLMLLLGLCSTACRNLEPELHRATADPTAIIVVKDANGTYWAFVASRIARITGNKITITQGTIVAKGTGTAPAMTIANALVKLRSNANPGGFGMLSTSEKGSDGDVSGKIENMERDVELDVREIVYPKKPN